MTDTPVIFGRPDTRPGSAGSTVLVWCAHCNRNHVHGRHISAPGCDYDMLRPQRHRCTCPIGSGNGHRVAHCHKPGSPYENTGYVIKEIAPA